jgi:hypothetical protein
MYCRLAVEIGEMAMSMKLFETSDFYLSCYLRSLNYELVDVRREGQRAIFVFHDDDDRRAAMISFYNDDGAVRPLTFVGIIKEMKSLLHNL